MSPALLEVRDLARHFAVRGGTVRAVDGVSFRLEAGECLGLVGESGCGKTTVARTLVGLERASAGSIRLEGTELTGLSPRRWFPHRRKMQMIFQDPYSSLDPRQTVSSILTEPLAIHRLGTARERRRKAMSLLDVVGLGPQHLFRYPHELSGGQRQRIGIARALALEPRILVCDEPVSALDVSIQAQIINLLGELTERLNLALLFIAHDLAVVRHISDRVAVMYLGRIVELGSAAALFENPRHPYTRALLSAVPVPDPRIERRRERIVLPGDAGGTPGTPSPTGCAFAPRCPRRAEVGEDRCRRERPRLQAPRSESDHSVACLLREAR